MLGIKYFGDPWGLYALDKESQLAVIGAHHATHGKSEGTVSQAAATHRRGTTRQAAELPPSVPATVDSTPEAWEAFTKFHDGVG